MKFFKWIMQHVFRSDFVEHTEPSRARTYREIVDLYNERRNEAIRRSNDDIARMSEEMRLKMLLANGDEACDIAKRFILDRTARIEQCEERVDLMLDETLAELHRRIV